MLLCWLPTLFGQTYEVTGVIHSKTYFGPRPEESDSFKLIVNNCQWFLHEEVQELKMSGIPQTNNFDYIEASFDGEKYYTVNSLASQARGDSNSTHVAVGQIGSGIIPVDTGSHVRDLWLGFASHCYFYSITNEWLYPLFMQRNDAKYVNGQFAVKSFVDFLPGKIYLPSKVIYTFHYEGTLNINGLTNTEFGTNAIFAVDSSTNIESILIPTHYKINKYSINGRLTEEVEVTDEISTNVTIPQAFVPRLPGKTYVSDLRFPSINENENANYTATNWPEIKQATPLYQIESNANIVNEKNNPDSSIGRNHNMARIVILALMCISVIPLIISLVRKQKK